MHQSVMFIKDIHRPINELLVTSDSVCVHLSCVFCLLPIYKSGPEVKANFCCFCLFAKNAA